MQAVVATEFHIEKMNEKYYAKTQFSTILYRYYKSFGRLKIIARVKEVKEAPNSSEDVTDILLDVLPLNTLEKSMLHLYDKSIMCLLRECDLAICRVPSIIAYRVADCAKYMNKRVFVELMGDAWDSYWNHGMYGKLIAPYMYFKMKKVVKSAEYAVYVTERFLQKRYPCDNASISASNVLIEDVPAEIFEKRCKKIRNDNVDEMILMTSASVDIMHKGQQYVIEAIPELNKRNIKVKYVLVGGGDQDYLKKIAKKNGVSNQVIFTGRLRLEEVLEMLDEADLYLQPSLQEGLPRSVIEAMSRGCPCIGAKTAGIPELIEKRFLVNRKNSKDIVEKISLFHNMSIEEKVSVAGTNYFKAKEYYADVLDQRRNNYFSKIYSDIEKL